MRIFREESWIKEMKMGAFLSVAKGSCEKPYLLEMKYFGSSNEDERPLVLVGKGKSLKFARISRVLRGNFALNFSLQELLSIGRLIKITGCNYK